MFAHLDPPCCNRLCRRRMNVTDLPPNAPAGKPPCPVWNVHERNAMNAFEVHSALVRMENRDRTLKRNPVWQCLRMDAYEAFVRAFEAVK